MADHDLIEGDGWISDESSFYGDDDVKTEFEAEARRELSLPWTPFAHILKKQAQMSLSSKRNESHRASNKASERAVNKKATLLHKTTSRFDVDEAAEFIQSDRFQGNASAWQHDETIEDFLKRLPVAEPATSLVGPWLWVGNRHKDQMNADSPKGKDVEAFMKTSEGILHEFNELKTRVEAQNASKAPATVTRHMGPHRARLEEDLLAAAVRTHVTCGKWMLFPYHEDLPRTWRLVAKATAAGKLGPVSKVGTYDPLDTKGVTLICIYTSDFTDIHDVLRVLSELLELEVFKRDGRPIYYKCDAYTYLGISSDNAYKVKASLFASSDVLANAAGLRSGAVARLRNHGINVRGL